MGMVIFESQTSGTANRWYGKTIKSGFKSSTAHDFAMDVIEELQGAIAECWFELHGQVCSALKKHTHPFSIGATHKRKDVWQGTFLTTSFQDQQVVKALEEGT
eukprot:1187932-Amphidinium_carterae.1